MKDSILISIVEDDPVFSKLIQKELIKTGYSKIDVNNDGVSFMFKLSSQTHKPAVVILDSNLENGTTGLQIFKQIKEDSPDTQVIFLSAQTEVEVAAEAIKKGAFDYFTKNSDSLWRTVNAVNKIVGNLESRQKQKKAMFVKGAILFVLGTAFATAFYFFNLKFKVI